MNQFSITINFYQGAIGPTAEVRCGNNNQYATLWGPTKEELNRRIGEWITVMLTVATQEQ